jgi:L-2-hydroxyglutarate oxidase LhgO
MLPSMAPGPHVCVTGGGIVGLATAHRLTLERPDLRVTVLEKEPAVARHQSGRNSGVLHTGIYYVPGSRKARLARAGKAAMERFCDQQGIARRTCGKVLVATHADELGRLEALLERGRASGVDCERVGVERLRELEPHVAGIAAIHVPEAGVVDYGEVTRRLAELLAEAGHAVRTGVRVRSCRVVGAGVRVETDGEPVEADLAVVCGGLHADRLARASGVEPGATIVPFRGEFFDLVPERRGLVRGRVSPLPDPALPFLGPHLTPTVHGGVQCGPNAVLAAAREGYAATAVEARDLLETLAWPGFARLVARHWRSGYGELARSLSVRAFARACQRLVPELEPEDLIPLGADGAGVRAQAVSAEGELVDDFLVRHAPRSVHVINAPSPAATASLAIAAEVASEALRQL